MKTDPSGLESVVQRMVLLRDWSVIFYHPQDDLASGPDHPSERSHLSRSGFQFVNPHRLALPPPPLGSVASHCLWHVPRGRALNAGGSERRVSETSRFPGVETTRQVGDIAEAGAPQNTGRDRASIAASTVDHQEFLTVQVS